MDTLSLHQGRCGEQDHQAPQGCGGGRAMDEGFVVCKVFHLFSAILFLGASLGSLSAQAAEYTIYGTYRPIDLGENGEPPPKDFYINMGANQGLGAGATLEVLRKVSTFDLESQRLYKDLFFPIATLKVIHVESNAAVARLDKLLPINETPAYSPQAIMVGDLVRRP